MPGIDVTGHRSRRVTADDLAAADLVGVKHGPAVQRDLDLVQRRLVPVAGSR